MKTSVAYLLAFVSMPLFALAQTDSSAQRLFRIGFQTSTAPITDVHATDSTSIQLYIAPQISYTHKSGFGVLARTYFFTGGTTSRNFLTTLSPGFEKDNDKLYAAVNYSHFFYNRHSAIPYTPIKNELYANMRLKTKVLQPLLTVNAGWGTDSLASSSFDMNVLAGIAHDFDWSFGNRHSLSLLPAIILNAGTNNYFSLLKGSPYIATSKNYKAVIHSQQKGRGNTGSGTNTAGSTTATNSFGLSQLEGNLYIYYSIRKITLEPDASIFFPFRSGEAINSFFQLNVNVNF